jgi:hypothetical protein
MLIPSCGRSISPCCFSADKSRARFFAPLRCAQNDSMAGEYTDARLSSAIEPRAGADPCSLGSAISRRDLWESSTDNKKPRTCRTGPRYDCSRQPACRIARCRRVYPRQSLAGSESLGEIVDAKKRASAPARRAATITTRLKSRPSADGLRSEPWATFSSRGSRPVQCVNASGRLHPASQFGVDASLHCKYVEGEEYENRWTR